MAYMALTVATFQPPMFRSNALADANMKLMELTLATFQPETSELKAVAELNM
jgi:hypothetical protein